MIRHSGKLHDFGNGHALESGLEFMIWACSQSWVTRDSVMAYLGCSRATAYRYLQAWYSLRDKYPHLVISTAQK